MGKEGKEEGGVTKHRINGDPNLDVSSLPPIIKKKETLPPKATIPHPFQHDVVVPPAFESVLLSLSLALALSLSASPLLLLLRVTLSGAILSFSLWVPCARLFLN
ncbi:hypothetical protein BT93_L3530 [Corymbia citriodora subsp. variegata]|uniref:Uncharacterized protein n=1 Tax=Corymbia citriodora subsp. variegata TaxID=360336 RepID=A0A8T0CMB9_CORYI|nr:hypothetical protein BT93_L3530 [Corymbia citriodora subsp. variegata]